MGGDLRAGLGAGWLRRTLAMRVIRVASATVLSLVTLLLCGAAEQAAARAFHVDESTAVSNAIAQHVGAVVAAEQRLANRKAAQSARASGPHPLLARSRATDGDGDAAPVSALLSPTAQLFGDVAESTRARLRLLALGHAPYGEPSPFDATAPPAPKTRNG